MIACNHIYPGFYIPREIWVYIDPSINWGQPRHTLMGARGRWPSTNARVGDSSYDPAPCTPGCGPYSTPPIPRGWWWYPPDPLYRYAPLQVTAGLSWAEMADQGGRPRGRLVRIYGSACSLAPPFGSGTAAGLLRCDSLLRLGWITRSESGVPRLASMVPTSIRSEDLIL